MLADLERRRLKAKTIRNYRDALIVLGQQANLDNVDAVVTVVSRIKGRTLLDTVMAAYNHYSRFWKLSRAEYNIRRDRRRKLPILTPETTLQASLVIPHRLKWKAYFRLLYETGARASEPFSMTVADADPDHQKVRLGTAKGSGDVQERELPISPLLAEQLRELTRNKPPDTWLFTKTRSPTEPLNYHQAERLKAVIKKELISAGYNVRGYRLHVYRHAFATRLYWATKDLPLVSRSLGHRNLEALRLGIRKPKPNSPASNHDNNVSKPS